MSREKPMTKEEIYQAGLEALCRELGPVGMARFLQQLEGGTGDFTAERQAWVGRYTVAELAERIRGRQQQEDVIRGEGPAESSHGQDSCAEEPMTTAEG